MRSEDIVGRDLTDSVKYSPNCLLISLTKVQ